MGYLVDIVTQTHIFTVVDDYYILGEFTISILNTISLIAVPKVGFGKTTCVTIGKFPDSVFGKTFFYVTFRHNTVVINKLTEVSELVTIIWRPTVKSLEEIKDSFVIRYKLTHSLIDIVIRRVISYLVRTGYIPFKNRGPSFKNTFTSNLID